jgi:hypothetical protein
MVGRLLVTRAWFEPIEPGDFPDLALPDPATDQAWSCTVEYVDENRADSRFDRFDAVMDWAISEGAQELHVFSLVEREFHQFAPAEEQRLREQHGRSLPPPIG